MEKTDKVLVKEGLPTKRSVEQLKKLRKQTKKDIGDKADYGKGDNLENNMNAVDMGIESFEDYVSKAKPVKTGFFEHIKPFESF